jgi:ectoine hydroxylase-related dioxygenase (phytanoyl-CoA dioxygenase family)
MTQVTYEPTAKDIAGYWQKGYWISPKLIDDDRIARLRKALERVFKNDFDGYGSLFDGQLKVPDDSFTMRRAINAWWVNHEIRDMVCDPGIGRIAAALMKADRARLWADQVIIKPGTQGKTTSKGSNIGWHQDAAYWHINSNRENMVTAWIALQDTDLSIGGMRTLEQSHRWGLIPDSDKFYDPNLSSQREFFEKKGLGPWVDEPCILPAGHASFHHSLCFHGSEENKTNQPRLSVIGHYMPDGATFTPSGKFQVFLRLLGPDPQPGIKFVEPYWPLVNSD